MLLLSVTTYSKYSHLPSNVWRPCALSATWGKYTKLYLKCPHACVWNLTSIWKKNSNSGRYMELVILAASASLITTRSLNLMKQFSLNQTKSICSFLYSLVYEYCVQTKLCWPVWTQVSGNLHNTNHTKLQYAALTRNASLLNDHHFALRFW
jgi:hypothetical protein